MGIMRKFAEKYNLRKEVRKKTIKSLRFIYIWLLAIGKIKKRLRNFRLKKASLSIAKVVRIKRIAWRNRIKILSLKRICNFILDYENQNMLKIFVQSIMTKIIFIQKWIKKLLLRKNFTMCLLLKQWHSNEGEVVKKWLKLTGNYIPKSASEDIVPQKVRQHFLLERIKVI